MLQFTLLTTTHLLVSIPMIVVWRVMWEICPCINSVNSRINSNLNSWKWPTIREIRVQNFSNPTGTTDNDKSFVLLFEETKSNIFLRLYTEAGTISDVHICNKDYHIFSTRSSQLGIFPYFWNSETAWSFPQKSHPAGQEVSNFDWLLQDCMCEYEWTSVIF